MEPFYTGDRYLKPLINRLDGYRAVCFNVYDTLLLRTVAEPGDVFVAAGHILREQCPAFRDIAPDTFACLRKEAETRARQSVRGGVTLARIYAELDKTGLPVDAMITAEIQAEKSCSYLNPNVLSFLEYCARSGKVIALICESCFSSAQLREVLEAAGMNLSAVSLLWVSSETEAETGNGSLPDSLAEALPDIPPERILYIGDDSRGSLLTAHRHGMDTAWYGGAREADRGFLAMERQCYDSELGELLSLRSVAMNTFPEALPPDSRFWFSEGCGIIGPLYSCFAEWVIYQLEETGIRTVLAFMREGTLLEQLIRESAQRRGMDISVHRLYISRKITYNDRFAEDGKEMIDYYLKSPRLLVRDLFYNFHYTESQMPLPHLHGYTIGQCRENGHFDELYGYLMKDTTRTRIRENLRTQKRLLARYITGLTGGADFVTVDIGFAGTIQRGIGNFLRELGYQGRMLHLMMIGNSRNSQLALADIEVRGWLSCCGINARHADRLILSSLQVFEGLINDDVGSTRTYREEDGAVVPVLEPSLTTGENRLRKSALWQGVLSFQQYLFILIDKKPKILEDVQQKKTSFFAMLFRLLEMPLHHEAIAFGSLNHEDNIIFSARSPICKPEDQALLRKLDDPELFILTRLQHSPFSHTVVWPEGVIEHQRPHFFWRKYLCAYTLNGQVKLFFFNCFAADLRIGIYGVTPSALSLAREAYLSGCARVCFVDRDIRLRGESLYGYPVYPPEATVGEIDLYIIAPLKYSDEIRGQLAALYQGRPMPEIILRTQACIDIGHGCSGTKERDA